MISLIYDMEEGGEMSNINSHQYPFEFIPAICPKCGGELRVPKDRDIIKCMYCGVDILLRDEDNAGKRHSIDTITHLGKVAFQSKNFAEAYRYYSQALEIDSHNPVWWVAKGSSAAWQSDISKAHFDETIHCIQEALRLGLQDKDDGFEAAILNFADCVIAYTEMVLAHLDNQWDREIKNTHSIQTYIELQEKLRDDFFSNYAENIKKSVNFIWEVMPGQKAAQKFRMLQNYYTFRYWLTGHVNDYRLPQQGNTPLFLLTLLSKIKESFPEAFCDKSTEADFVMALGDLQWKIYIDDQPYTKIVKSVLEDIIQRYHPKCTVGSSVIYESEGKATGHRVWFLCGLGGEPMTLSKCQSTGLLSVWMAYNHNNQIVGFEFFRKGYNRQRCDLSDNKLRDSLIALEEAELSKY
jgi:tetratricopeptide (TPR) repeat protein